MRPVHIRDVAPETLDALKRLARSNHRSLQGELRNPLEKASRLAPTSVDGDGLDLVTVPTGGSSRWSRKEIYGDTAAR
jgi:hypothetical protein